MHCKRPLYEVERKRWRRGCYSGERTIDKEEEKQGSKRKGMGIVLEDAFI
jgi:hypothetical protein